MHWALKCESKPLLSLKCLLAYTRTATPLQRRLYILRNHRYGVREVTVWDTPSYRAKSNWTTTKTDIDAWEWYSTRTDHVLVTIKLLIFFASLQTIHMSVNWAPYHYSTEQWWTTSPVYECPNFTEQDRVKLKSVSISHCVTSLIMWQLFLYYSIIPSHLQKR
jgi:hypothetical protein